MAGMVWFPKDYKDDCKVLKKALMDMTKKYGCIHDVKLQTTVHYPNKKYTDITIYINEPLYIAYLLSGGTKLETEAPKWVTKQYPINVRLISKER